MVWNDIATPSWSTIIIIIIIIIIVIIVPCNPWLACLVSEAPGPNQEP